MVINKIGMRFGAVRDSARFFIMQYSDAEWSTYVYRGFVERFTDLTITIDS